MGGGKQHELRGKCMECKEERNTGSWCGGSVGVVCGRTVGVRH